MAGKARIESADLDVRTYAKYVLREGSVSEKRELLGNLRSRLVYQNKTIRLLSEVQGSAGRSSGAERQV